MKKEQADSSPLSANAMFQGEVVEIGDSDDGQPRIVIHGSREDIFGAGTLLFKGTIQFYAALPNAASLVSQLRLEDGFIPVPASTIKWGNREIRVPAFQVEQYLASVDADGNAVRTTAGKPRNNISQRDAIQAAIKGCAALLRGTQALAISLNVASVAENWTGGEVGKGELYRGLHRDTVSGPVTNDYVSPHENERRYLLLTNGHKIYDWSGHLWEHMFDDIHGDENGVVKGSIPADSPYLTSAPFGSMKKGMGYIPNGELSWSGGALVRGGCWCSEDDAGAFRLYYGWPDLENDYVGFRCTKPSAGL